MKFNKKNQYYPRQGHYYVMRNAAMGWSKPPMSIRRHRTSFPFVAISEDAEHRNFLISPNKISCFHGFSSLFTLQHRESFVIDGVIYKSVDQYYQMRKVKDLLGVECEKFTDGSSNNYSTLAKELLKQSSVDRRIIDKWRVTCGVNAIQKALLEKTRQSESLRDALVKTGDNIIVHTYAADDFFGTGVPYKYVKDWCTGMEEKKVVVKFPMSYPLTADTLKNIPSIGKGRNVLGVIYMILREKINAGLLDSLKVDLIQFENVSDVDMSNNSNTSDHNSNSKKESSSMDIDFTADVESLSTSTGSANMEPSVNNEPPNNASSAASASQPSKVKKVQIRVKRTTAATRTSAQKASTTGPTKTSGATSAT